MQAGLNQKPAFLYRFHMFIMFLVGLFGDQDLGATVFFDDSACLHRAKVLQSKLGLFFWC